MSKPTTPNDQSQQQTKKNPVEQFTDLFNTDKFQDWHRLKKQRKNHDEGYDNRNDPAFVPENEEVSPHTLLSCQRMATYSAENAPAEERDPDGIFKFGHDTEEYVEDFLYHVTHMMDGDMDVQNPVHVEYEDNGVTITGSTDPVITAKGRPIALTEVKTTKNLHWVRKRGGPDDRHRAQAHAYARGLMKKFELGTPPAIFFIYANRENLDTEIFEVEYDQGFWEETVMEWADELVEHRQIGELPAQLESGEDDYQCGYCDFKERCGNYEPTSKAPGEEDYSALWAILNALKDGETSVRNAKYDIEDVMENAGIDDYWWKDTMNSDMMNSFNKLGVKGFLPLTEYPEESVISHLMTYDDVQLTPTVALQYPDLIDDNFDPDGRYEMLYGENIPQREVHDWVCTECDETVSFGSGEILWDGNVDNPPECPSCEADLRGPTPEEQFE